MARTTDNLRDRGSARPRARSPTNDRARRFPSDRRPIGERTANEQKKARALASPRALSTPPDAAPAAQLSEYADGHRFCSLAKLDAILSHAEALLAALLADASVAALPALPPLLAGAELVVLGARTEWQRARCLSQLVEAISQSFNYYRKQRLVQWTLTLQRRLGEHDRTRGSETTGGK